MTLPSVRHCLLWANFYFFDKPGETNTIRQANKHAHSPSGPKEKLHPQSQVQFEWDFNLIYFNLLNGLKEYVIENCKAEVGIRERYISKDGSSKKVERSSLLLTE